MTKFNLDKLRALAQPPKEHRPRMTPDEIAEKKKMLHEAFKKRKEQGNYRND